MANDIATNFWTYWFIAVGVIILIIVLEQFGSELLDTLSGLFTESLAHPDRYSEGEKKDDGRIIKHCRREWKWHILFPIIKLRRRRWFDKDGRRRAERKSRDAIIESLATHDDILETMYGKPSSPFAVYRGVKRQYRP